MVHMELNQLTSEVIGAAIEVHKQLGLILNFNVSLMRDGITRVANGLPDC